MAQRTNTRIVWAGEHLDVAVRGHWEYVRRRNITGIVGIVAVTDDGKLVLVEQYRPPLDARVIELPAGLAGDIAGQEDETLATSARRELLEETGYEAREMVPLFTGASSAGLSDEMIAFFGATGLRKVGDGGGDESEDITVHEICVEGVREWLTVQQARGAVVDLKIYAALPCCGDGVGAEYDE